MVQKKQFYFNKGSQDHIIESLPQILIFKSPISQCRRSEIFQTMNSDRSNKLSLKHDGKEILKSKFVAN